MKNKFFFSLLFLIITTLNYSQKNETVYMRNDRFVVEYVKQIQPGDNYVLTGFKLYEFFENNLIHVDTSNVSKSFPVNDKNFDTNLVDYEFGKTINNRKLLVNLNPENFSIGYYQEEGIYDEKNNQLFVVSDILMSAPKKISLDAAFSKKTGISKKETYEHLVDLGYDELIDILKTEDGRIKIDNKNNGMEELSQKSFTIKELNFDLESNSFYYSNTGNKLNENQTFDYDGNVYNTVAINGQVWMAENLKATHFSNGDEIRNAKSDIEWSNLNTPGFSAGFLYADTTSGYFYNGYTLIDDRNVCPLGFHVPNRRDIVRLYNSINVYDERVKIKPNGVAKVKLYPKILAPIIEPIGAALTIGTYSIAGAVDIIGNIAWATTDLLVLGPIKLWKKEVLVKTDSTEYYITKRTAFPTYEGFSLFGGLWESGFHLAIPPSMKLNNDDYETNEEDYEIRNSFSHIDKLKSSDGYKLTDEYKFNLSESNKILAATLNYSQQEMMMSFTGNELDMSYSDGLGSYNATNYTTLPFTNYERILFWGNKMDHELQQMKYYKYSPFINRNGAKIRCVKD
jgi:hypothetical protein